MKTESFIADTYNRIRESILNIDGDKFPDIYVISFYKDNVDDDPRCPTLTIGFNTLSQSNSCIPIPGQHAPAMVASGTAEARWNYAFWLQNEELLIGEGEYDPVAGWVKQLPCYYTDEDEDEDFDKAFEAGKQIQEQFIEIMITHAKRLHDEGIIRSKFGVDIPIIIHELEYYELPVDWTRRGNPKGLTDEFEDWIKSF